MPQVLFFCLIYGIMMRVMEMAIELPKRKRLRLDHFDYSTPGAYFITICTHNRRCTLSHVVGAIHESPETELTEYGKIVDDFINHIPEHFKVSIDEYVIMPNHVHLIVMIADDEELRATRSVGYLKNNWIH